MTRAAKRVLSHKNSTVINPSVSITKSLYEENIEAGLIIPAENPDWRPTTKPGKIQGKKTSTQVLMELRAEERS